MYQNIGGRDYEIRLGRLVVLIAVVCGAIQILDIVIANFTIRIMATAAIAAAAVHFSGAFIKVPENRGTGNNQ